MSTLHGIYDSAGAAEQAIAQLTAAGITRDAIMAIDMAGGMEAARAHMGSFAEGLAHAGASDHVGGFADSGAHEHDTERDHVGSFADSGAHEHDAERDHVGSFADGEDFAADLARAGLSNADARAVSARLNQGATLLLVRAEGALAEQADKI
ncbi:MAG TPA: hypothetical protein VFX76_22370, partial [Roseiflexaceae bacterium]|nr:hypothetical protein [Roseiflexaceae bacterium]